MCQNEGLEEADDTFKAVEIPEGDFVREKEDGHLNEEGEMSGGHMKAGGSGVRKNKKSFINLGVGLKGSARPLVIQSPLRRIGTSYEPMDQLKTTREPGYDPGSNLVSENHIRVMEAEKEAHSHPNLSAFLGNMKILVLGRCLM